MNKPIIEYVKQIPGLLEWYLNLNDKIKDEFRRLSISHAGLCTDGVVQDSHYREGIIHVALEMGWVRL